MKFGTLSLLSKFYGNSIFDSGHMTSFKDKRFGKKCGNQSKPCIVLNWVYQTSGDGYTKQVVFKI